jgi:PKD repeat protein
LEEGETATLTVTGFNIASGMPVKVQTSDGTFVEMTYYGGGGGPTNTAPTAEFSFSPTDPETGETVAFTDGSSDSDGTIASWLWDFGDGTPTTTIQNPTHVYTSANTYTVSLTVTDDDGATDSVTHDVTVTPQQVIFVSAGTPSNSGGPNGNPTPGYPSGMQADDLILLQVVVRGNPTTTVTPPSGFSLLYGPDATGGTTARVTQWIYYKFATGTESGTATVTVSQTSGIYGRGAMMYAFRNVALASFTESEGISTASSGTISPPSVTTLGVKRLAVAFEALAGDPTGTLGLDSFTGESGGDWTMAATVNVYHGSSGDHHFENGLQTATIANAGTISGGSDSIAAYYWVVRSFALKPR